MRAAFYESFGPADAVLKVGTKPDPRPGPGEVLVRVHATGVNPSDVKLRAGARAGTRFDHPFLIPHSDGAGVIEAVGEGVFPGRVGQRVWIWNGHWQRQCGTAAEYIALPSDQAVLLPEGTSYVEAACLGIPALTAWYALFAAGPIDGQTVLVTGGAGTVGRYACQMARLGGARVIATVSSDAKAKHSTAETCVNYLSGRASEAIMDLTDGKGVDRIVEVDFGGNQAQSLNVLKPGGVIAAYASTSKPTPELAFYPLMFRDVTLRMLVVYLMDGETRSRAKSQLNDWLREGKLSHAPVVSGTLNDVVAAHRLVEAGAKLGTVVLEV
jgi:NADPH2:quinone reductase